MRKRVLALAVVLVAMLGGMLSWRAEAEPEGRWPLQGDSVKTNGKLQVDVSNVSEGYFLASLQSQDKHRMKLRVVKDQATLTYDINSDGEYEVYPLQLGDGTYEIQLYENVTGNKYSAAGKVSVRVTLSEADASFYYPNQYVHYTELSEAVEMADLLCEGKSRQAAYDEVVSFMSSSFAYDFVRALTIKAGELPDIDGCYSKRMGICQDLSAVTCCMLRTQGIPARLMIGYADKQYHAWVETSLDGKELFFDPTAAVNGISNVSTYTVERYY